MVSIADLEITIHRWDPDVTDYEVEMRFRDPSSFVDRDPAMDRTVFDIQKLWQHAVENNTEDYGRLLTNSLFTARLLEMFRDVRGHIHDDGYLRLRLFITSSVPELNDLRWEMLRDPLTLTEESSDWLATSERILFSRYLSSPHFKQVHLHRAEDNSALIVIANPQGLGGADRGRYAGLTPLDVSGLFKQTAAALPEMRLTFLGDIPPPPAEQLSPAVALTGKKSTLDNLIDELRRHPAASGRYSILYLICHGAIINKRPWLFLEGDDGRVERVDGLDFVSRISQLQQRPSLVVLASCESAGAGEHPTGGRADAEQPAEERGALASLGPRLARAGIPAVVAMQGRVALETLSQFIPAFFRELRREGQVDRAMAVGRSAIRLKDDKWIPALFSRLSGGRIWQKRGFVQDERAGSFSPRIKWNALLTSIREGMCTPIVGPGVHDPLFGSTREIARRWASTYHFPMSYHAEEDLPQVAQYLSVNQDPFFIRSQLKNTVSQEIIKRFGDQLTIEDRVLPDMIEESKMEELITKAGSILTATRPAEPHKVLAGLPCSIYLTTNPDSLLLRALERAQYIDDKGVRQNKRPNQELYRWDPTIDNWPKRISKNNPQYTPSVAEPLVYHLFGSIQVRDSFVLTEDNYFAYLYHVTRPDNNMPSFIRTAMTDRALLFIGYNLEDWDFRVLIQSFREKEGKTRLQNYTHVAVQLDPEETRMIDPDRARQYLEQRFGEISRGMRLSIYWGSVEEFMGARKAKWNQQYPDRR